MKFLAVGHGLQNYTCANDSATAAATGALAVLYDATALYSSPAFANISSAVLWDQAIPLILLNQAAAGPVSAAAPATKDETAYQANTVCPFATTNDALSLPQDNIKAPFLGVHYFDALGAPTFDLSASSDKLFFSGAKTGDVKAPTTADKGLLETGAVDWLQLGDNARGLSKGLSSVYRVVTAGGVVEACSVSGANPKGQVFSVPYAAQYWFFG